MRRTIIFLIFLYFLFCNLAFAQSAQELYRKANLSYENEDYKKAISLYKKLIDMDRVNPGLFYNLGNSYFKSKNLGKAVVNYERALRLAPRDKDIKLNLKLVRSMAVDKIDMPERGFVLDLILFLYDRMNINELTLLVSGIYLVLVILLIFSINFIERRRGIFYTVGGLIVLLSFFMIFLVSKIHKQNFLKEAIIVSEKVDIRSGPKEDYILQFSLHEGTKVRVLKEREKWCEIELSKDLRGWLPKDSIEVI